MPKEKFKKKIITVRHMHELLDFVQDMNNFKETLVLSGWLVDFQEDRMFIDTLIFETKPVNVICEDDNALLKKSKKNDKKS